MKKALSFALAVLMIVSAMAAFSIISSAETSVGVYGSGMENWGGSPNKGAYDDVTQILFCPDPWDGEYYAAGLEVTIRMQAVDGSSDDTFTTNVVTTYNGGDWGICRVEPVLMDTPWIPVKDQHYYGTFTFVDKDGETVTVTATNGEGEPFEFYLDREPVVPGVTPITMDLEIHPAYGVIENWGSDTKTYFIVAGKFAKVCHKSDLAPEEGSPSVTMKVVITDETTGETYTISRYAFDNRDAEIYGDDVAFFRLALCDYGIIPQADHEYTVTLAFFDARGSMITEESSEVGAFTGGNDDFLANGAIIPEEFPHMYDEAGPQITYGDVNGDGAVNKKDSLALKRYLADDSYEIDMDAADVNGDETVNKKDSLRLKQYLAGWDVQLGA